VHRARAALDASGKVVAVMSISKGFSRQQHSPLTNRSRPDRLIGQSMACRRMPTQIFGTPAESYASRTSCSLGDIPQFRRALLAAAYLALRDPVGPEIHFGSEQFIDELRRPRRGPGRFPLRYLTEPRHAAVVKAVAEKSGWSSLGKGKGIAFAERNGTAVAVVAQVEVDRASGRSGRRKFWVRTTAVSSSIRNPAHDHRGNVDARPVRARCSRKCASTAIRAKCRLGELSDPRHGRDAPGVDRDRAHSTIPRSHPAAPASRRSGSFRARWRNAFFKRHRRSACGAAR